MKPSAGGAGERDTVERLVQLVSAEGFGGEASHELEEALELLAASRTTPQEGRALEALLTLNATRRLPEALVVPLAAALVERGENAAAARALAEATSPAALVLRADLLAASGRLAEAADVVERVLLRDIDWPGARERHARWRGAAAALGESRSASARGAAATKGSRADGGSARPLERAPFRIVREVARGGTGTVYEAEDRDLGRAVALKVYHQAARDRAQLLHEARVAVDLAGEGVVRVYDVDVDHGWLAMSWAPLGALGPRLRARDAAVLQAIRGWAPALAAALARVHGSGWVHHDVKPANVLLEAPDRALLTDFATARRVGEPGPPGSRGYVSPERLAGRPSDPRDDVFGFGRVLEAALDALTADGRAESDDRGLSAYRALARTCTGPDEGRPVDGADLTRRLAI
jgi:serine/threonine-protein kinase